VAATAGFTVKDATPQLMKALAALGRRAIMVGVPADEEQPHLGTGTVESNKRDDDNGKPAPINNATIGYIHEGGAPEAGIPPRPHLVPGINAAKEKLIKRFEGAGRAALAGNTAAVDRYMTAAGIEAVSSVKRAIQEGIPPPLKPATIARRRKRSKASTYRRKAINAGDVTPLIDTAQYINSISFVLRK
jgi:hypothetical protein